MSRLSNADQQKIFSTPPPGVRKIILATNIAETSITINDVVYVIDAGVHKEHKVMGGKGISSLDAEWVSKANVAQRKGRAGRVKAGECFHLYTQEKMHSFNENPTPEILRVPLEKTVLDCKTYSEKEKALEFLQQFPQPPTVEAIKAAVIDLVQLGALDDNETLTPLGRRIASFTTHPKLSKALIHSTIFKVTNPIVDLATMLSNNSELFASSVHQKEDIRKLKQSFHPTSDHQALYWLNQQYEDLKRDKGYREANEFCYSNYIRRERIGAIGDLRKICIEHLKQARMLQLNSYQNHGKEEEEDKYSNVDELVKGVLLSGLNTMIRTKYTVKSHGKLSKVKDVYTDQGQRAFISSDSVNHQIHKRVAEGLLLYCGAVHSQERRGVLVRDTSLLAPITVFFFSSNIKKKFQNEEVSLFEVDGKRIKLQCSPEQADKLFTFRDIIWATVQYYIENQGFTASNYYLRRFEEDGVSFNESTTINNFRDIMVRTLAKILNDAEILLDDTSSDTSTKSINEEKPQKSMLSDEE